MDKFISTEDFIDLFLKTHTKQRFCFILGSGASRTSGIKTGIEMMRQWKNELDNLPEEELNKRIHDFISSLKKESNEFKIIEEEYLSLFNPDYSLNSKDYSMFYDIRFYNADLEGRRYLESSIKGVTPNIGYYYLAEVLTKTKNRVVITTNFDSLTEDAIYYTSSTHPLVIGHEFLADYILEREDLPIVIKIHRDLLFSPMNNSRDLEELNKSWESPLSQLLDHFVPIVIGYGGGDNTLMHLLKTIHFKKGIYWCSVDGQESEDIKTVVKDNGGAFVKISGFDEFIYLLATRCNLIENTDMARALLSNAQTRAYDFEQKRLSFAKKNTSQLYRDRVVVSEEKQKEWLKSQTAVNPFDYIVLESKKYKRVLAAQDAGDYNTALNLVDELIAKNPSNHLLYRRRARIYENKLDLDSAEKDYRKTIELNPEDIDAYIQLGGILISTKRWKDGIECYNKLRELLPPEEQDIVNYNLGIAYDGLSKWKTAIKYYTKEIDDQGIYTLHCYINRGRDYRILKKLDLAISDFRVALDIGDTEDKDYVKGYINIADCYCEKEDYVKAEYYYNCAIALRENDYFLKTGRGEVRSRGGNYREALNDFNDVLSKDPENGAALLDKGIVLHHLEKDDLAIEILNHLLTIEPLNPKAYCELGIIYEEQNDDKLALSCYEKALNYDPQNLYVKAKIDELSNK